MNKESNITMQELQAINEKVKELEEAIKRLKAIKNAKLDGDSEIALFEFAEGDKYVNVILNYIENSISKEVIEKNIEELKSMNVEGEVFTTSVNFAIKTLQELLEDK